MSAGVLIDTCILTDVMRGYVPAAHYLRASPEPFFASAVSVAELYQHAKDGTERSALSGLISALEILPIDAAIAERAGIICRDYSKSHRVTIVHGLIAACAELNDLKLATMYPRHFPTVKRATAPYQKPMVT